MKVLFAGFAGKLNSSKMVLDRIECEPDCRVKLRNCQATAEEKLISRVDGNEYDAVVLLGNSLTLPYGVLRIETVAQGEDTRYRTNANPTKFAKTLGSLGRKVIVSNTARPSLGNKVYASLLKHISEHNLPCKVILVQLPGQKRLGSAKKIAEEIMEACWGLV